MTEFLQSIKSDLFSRRLLPFAALLGIALIAAGGYAATGGSNGSTSTPAASAPAAPATSGAAVLPVTVAPANPNEAVAETPSGVHFQSKGPTRDPFVPLPSPPSANSASGSGSASSTSSKSAASSSQGSPSGGSGSSSGGSSSGGQKAPAAAPKKPTKPTFPYIVSVLFGRASTTPGQPVTLIPYESLKPRQPLPSKQDVRLSFERVTSKGNGAVFKLVVPPILTGSGICLPSTSECQTIDLEVGHTEQLEYTEADGQVAVYELKVVSITKKSAGANAARVGHKANAALARGKARAAQSIGVASALRAPSK
jgi:hypothetical protein